MKLTEKILSKPLEEDTIPSKDNLERLELAKPITSDIVVRLTATGNKKLEKMANDLDNAVWKEIQKIAKKLKL